MLLQRIISSARAGAKGIHPERNVMIIPKRDGGNKFLYVTRGKEIPFATTALYACIFVGGSLMGPVYFLLQFKDLREERNMSN